MYEFEYVSRKEAAPYKKELIEIINKVQNQVRSHFTFQFTFIGSSEHNMITCDFTTNKGFDFDVNIEINDDEEYYKPKEIRDILREAFNRIYGGNLDSTFQRPIRYFAFFKIIYTPQSMSGQPFSG